jgi:hypothetical protein
VANSEPFTPPQSAVSQNASPTPSATLSDEAQKSVALPTFNNPDVNAFIKEYDQFARDYMDAIKAMNAGDPSKIQAMGDKSPDMLQTIPKIAAHSKQIDSRSRRKFRIEGGSRFCKRRARRIAFPAVEYSNQTPSADRPNRKLIPYA